MKFKNSFTLNRNEAAELFAKLAESLYTRNKLDFEVKGNSATLDVGDEFQVELEFSDNSFEIELEWKEVGSETKSEDDWRSEFDKDMEDAGLPVAEVKSPTEIPPATVKTPTVEEPIKAVMEEDLSTIEAEISAPLKAHVLPDRTPLQTTTLSYDPGYWTSSFALDEIQSSWAEIEIDGDLANTRWNVDQDATISAPSIAPAKSVRRAVTDSDDDDLFSALDDLDAEPTKKGRRKSKTKPKPVPTHKKVKAPKNIPSAKSIIEEKQAEEWKEPAREDISTGDDWVKPSEFLKKKDAEPKKVSSIPSPGSNIPSPGTKVKSPEISRAPVPSREKEADWVKTSDIPKASKNSIPAPKGSDDPRFKKPPTAPDKKKKDKKDKGWAEW